MSVAVLGNGRCGTNMVLEILRGSTKLSALAEIENKSLCDGRTYPKNYLTKSDTSYFDYAQLKNTLTINGDMKVIWMIRDPRDMYLSKVRRGQPKANGGDSNSVNGADDATPEGFKEDMDKMINIYKNIICDFHERIMLVKMENVILNIDETVKLVCSFLEIPFENDMLDFIPRMRNPLKKERYSTLDKTQVNLWQRWETAYDCFFSKVDYDVESNFKSINYITKYFGYDLTSFHCGGTLGDVYVLLCRLHKYTENEKIKCIHYTKHRNWHSLIKDVYSLNSNIELEFTDENNNCLSGFFTDVVTLDKKPDFFPNFMFKNVDKFSLPLKYVCVQLKSGRAEQERNIDCKNIQEDVPIVLIGTDNIQHTLKNVIDLRGKTTILESFEIIKKSCKFHGFIGVMCYVAVSNKINTVVYVTDKYDGHEYRLKNNPWETYCEIKRI